MLSVFSKTIPTGLADVQNIKAGRHSFSYIQDLVAWQVFQHHPLYLYLFLLIFKQRHSPKHLLNCFELLDFTCSFVFFLSSSHNCLFYYNFIFWPPFLLPLTFCVAFSFCFSLSSQLMTTNTQMVSLSLSLCHLSLVSLSNFLFCPVTHSPVPNFPSSFISCPAFSDCCTYINCVVTHPAHVSL